MLTTFQIVLIVIIGFILLSFLANMLNLQKYGIHILPFGIIFRTKFFNKILEKMGERGKKFWKILYDIGKVLAGIITIGLLGYFIVNPFLLIFRSPAGIGLQLLIPGVTIDFKIALLFILPILIVLIPHEIAHAVMAHREGVKIESSGVFIVLVFFGGFVELVREQIEKANLKSKIRIFLNGSAVNAVFSVFFVALYFLSPAIVSIGYTNPSGVLVTNVYDDYPADIVGIARGDVITNIGAYNSSTGRITYYDINDVEDYHIALSENLGASLLFIIFLDKPTRALVPTTDNPSSKKNSDDQIYLGINIYNYYTPKSERQSKWFPYYWNIQILYTLNISIMAVFLNTLPLVLTDGDKILHAYMMKRYPNRPKGKKILNIARIASFCLIAINIILSMTL
ncbi:MAG: hypothetical protein HeimAB125_20020 [Candidatus Heimdallarchaeota archaeon AB_125]|nr:MAG: hypothetical protein HeimAB125_20020 [Candidatus Heimdallarchaeota archaeon AB_125]